MCLLYIVSGSKLVALLELNAFKRLFHFLPLLSEAFSLNISELQLSEANCYSKWYTLF